MVILEAVNGRKNRTNHFSSLGEFQAAVLSEGKQRLIRADQGES